MLLFGIATKKCCYFGKHQNSDVFSEQQPKTVAFSNSNQKRLLFKCKQKWTHIKGAIKFDCTCRMQSKLIALTECTQNRMHFQSARRIECTLKYNAIQLTHKKETAPKGVVLYGGKEKKRRTHDTVNTTAGRRYNLQNGNR